MQAEIAGRLGEQRLGVALRHRRRRVVTLARAFEKIAAGLLGALDVAGLAGDAGDIFEPVVIRLEIFVADGPILDLMTFGHDAFAVALDHVRANAEIIGKEAPGLAVPVHAGAADPVAGQKAAPFADRKRGLRRVIPHRQRFLLRTQEDVMANAIAQLIGRGADVEIGRGVAPRAALDRDDVETGAGELQSENRSGPSETDDDDILAGETAGHQFSPHAGRPCIATGGNV